MLTNTTVDAGGDQTALDELRAGQWCSPRRRLSPIRYAQRNDAPIQRQTARRVLALGGGEDRRARPQRRQRAGGFAAARDGDDRLRRAAIGQRHGRFAQRVP